jgi:hypothetical protein
VPVIIFLKNQVAATGSTIRSDQRSAVMQAAQAPYLGQLQRLGATDVLGYHLVNAIAARVPASALAAIGASPGVASVIPDSIIAGPDPAVSPADAAGVQATTGRTTTAKTIIRRTTTVKTATGKTTAVKTTAVKTAVKVATVKTPPGACSATPQLEPEGLTLTRTDSTAVGAKTARSLGYTGAGVKVAFLADGIDTTNVNLMRGGKPVISTYKDFSGDGTTAATAGGEAFLDANAIAGQGKQVYNVAGFSAQAPASPCDVRIEGVAPGATLVALKVFSHADTSTTSAFLQAIDYAVEVDHVNVLNESFGSDPFPNVTSLDAVEEFNDMAVRAGTTVVVASGDAGPFNTIGSPAADPAVISVGASTDFRFYAQTDYAGADQFAPNGWESNNISALSSGGYTQDGQTLDLVAPGDLSFASCTAAPQRYSSCVNFLGKPSSVEESSGTSQSAALVAGAAALVIQAYAKEHQGTVPSPATVKQILLSTATDLGAPATEQGSGLLDTYKAVELASYMADCDPAGPTLELSSNQLNYAGKPGTAGSWAVTVTNTGKTAQKVAVTGRRFTAGSVVKTAAVTLSDSGSPHFTNWSGAASNYGRVTFTVPGGAAMLNTSIAWPATASEAGNANAPVRLVLVDPKGRLAAQSLPQGVSGYGSAQVLHPAAGTWTAVISSDTPQAGGTAGKVQFSASLARAAGFGSVSPSTLSLAPGASAKVRVAAMVPAGAGDSSGAVVLNAGPSGGGTVTVPVTLRGTVAAGLGVSGTFSGVLTGGNGRSPGEGQVAAYTFTVPSNLPVLGRDIDVNVALANDPANQVSGYLIAPDGETAGYGSSYLTTGFTSAGVPVESPLAQLAVYTSNPVPGVWTLLIDFTSPVPGDELADPFKGLIRFNNVGFSRGGLPDSPSVSLKREVEVTYPVSVSNIGGAPEDIFLDPRLTQLQTYTLQPQDQVAGVKLPAPATENPPEWLVPTMTSSVSVTVTSKAPVMFDYGPFPGDPDEASTEGLTARASFPDGATATPVTAGLWSAVPAEVGPFPAGGARPETATSSMTATTQEFDRSAGPATGDFWRFGVEPLATSASYSLLAINPGQTRTIDLEVKPTGPAGTVVHGMLYVDDFADSLQFLSGSQLVALPYEYTIG